MNSRQLMEKAFKCERSEAVPVTPHWWGIYKFQLAGMASGFEDEEKCWSLSGNDLAQVDINFYETFKPDMFHLSAGPQWDRRDMKWKQHEERLFDEARKLESKAAIDEYAAHVRYSKEEVLACGTYDHVGIIIEKYGKEVFVALNEGNPVGGIFNDNSYGFVEGMIAMLEKPDLMAYYIYKLYENQISFAQVLADKGVHGYIGSETHCSCDLISPQIYRDVVFPAHSYFYKEVEKTGMVPITYFLGDINPILKDIKKINARGLMVEESKKNFTLDVVDIQKRLDGSMVLFGNIDSVYGLYMGSTQDVKSETIRQLEAAKYGSFIMACGSPIALDTPKENIRCMINTTREFKLIY